MITQEILQGVHGWTNGKIVYDISVAHLDGQGNPTKYATLAAALGTNGANIPEAIRKGGMSVKFVRTSDNKYVQWRFTLSSFTSAQFADATNWTKCDTVDTSNQSNSDLDISDEEDNVIVRFKNGHIKTKNFDSSQDATEQKRGLMSSSDKTKLNTVEQGAEVNKVVTSNTANADLDVTDENGNIIMRLKNGHIRTKNFNSEEALLKKAESPASGYEVFSVAVDTTLPHRKDSSDNVQDSEVFANDKGIVIFPSTYKASGNPTRLCMFGHGFGGVIRDNSTGLSQHLAMENALLADGIAIFEINGTPGVVSSTAAHYAGPIFIRSVFAAYKYLIDKYNFKDDGILIYGYSVGGDVGLVLGGLDIIPVIAEVDFGGALDQWKSTYSKETVANKKKILEAYGIPTTGITLTDGGANVVPPQSEREYILSYKDLWAEYFELCHGITTNSIDEQYSVWVAPSTASSAEEEQVYSDLVISGRPPIMMVVGGMDDVIQKRYSYYLSTMINNGGGVAEVREFANGTHGASGESTSIIRVGNNATYIAKDGSSIIMPASNYEAYLFLKRFNY